MPARRPRFFVEQVVVLGVGNNLLTDEGAGIHAALKFQEQYGHLPGVRVVDGGTLSFTLSEHIDDADLLIVFDAARLSLPAGSVRVFADDEMDRFLDQGQRSVHEVGLSDLMAMSHLRNRLPIRRALVGVQPEYLGWGEQLTPAVDGAVAVMVEKAHALLCDWTPGFDRRAAAPRHHPGMVRP